MGRRKESKQEENGYNSDKDVVIEDFGKVPGTKNLYAQVRSYLQEDQEGNPAPGEPKVVVFRMVGTEKSKKGIRAVQVFRLSLEDAKNVADFLSGAIEEE